MFKLTNKSMMKLGNRKRLAREIRNLPLFPIIPVVPVLIMGGTLALAAACFFQLRKLVQSTEELPAGA